MSNPGDIPRNLLPESILYIGDKLLVCHNPNKVSSYGIWTHQNPLHFSTPLLLVQFSIVSLTSMLVDFLLKPLGQCTMISQIIGGIIFGPSILGHNELIGAILFPPRGRIIFETIATFGIMFFFFTVGVKMDPRMMIMPGWKPTIISLSALFTTLAFALFLSTGLQNRYTLEPKIALSLPAIAASQCILSFQNVSNVLGELKMLQSDLGRMAVSSALFSELVFLTATGCVLLATSLNNVSVPFAAALVFGVYILVLVFVIRPLIRRCARKLPEGKPVPESYISTIFILVLLMGFVSESIGQNFVYGPMMLGLVVPEGPPLGSAISERLEFPIGKLLYPSFMTASGLKTDFFSIKLQSLLVVGAVVLLSCMVKIIAVMIPALFMRMGFRESLVLGLMMTSKGISELVLYNLLIDTQALSGEAFALCVVSVIAVTAVITPLIKFLYDPSARSIALTRRTIHHSKANTEFRMLLCVHDQENIPEMINVLGASNATEESPISVTTVLLVELTGRANPMLIAHQPHRMLQPSSSRSGRIINALRQFELSNESCVSMQSYSSVSPFDTMHEDICRVALDQNTVIIVLPFHKHWEIDGSISSANRKAQEMNMKVIQNAPCSVGILVDKGLLRGTTSILTTQTVYQVGLIFIGGADDAEALSYAARMVKNPNVRLTIFRYLLLGSENTRERKVDNGAMDEVRYANVGNDRFVYQEEMIRDCVALAASIRSIGGATFDLILAGRGHQDYPLLVGFGAWIDCPELGIIGDLLSESDPARVASVLVVQQQRLKGRFITTRNQVQPLHDA